MKKNTLTTAVVASLAGIAGIANISTAINLNPDGLGQVLVYPYYTVNGGNDTLISVVNTTNIGKAVKVRFLEGYNSKEVLDFNLYLSPFDVWVGAITAASTDAASPGRLFSSDRSCTVPAIPAGGVSFRNLVYAGTEPDSATESLSRTREGHIEMIEMGSFPRYKVGSATTASDNGTYAASLHSAGTPPGCANIVRAWTDSQSDDFFGGTISANYVGSFGNLSINQADIHPPQGGMFGGAAVVGVANGTYINYAAEAIEGFSTVAQHTSPQNTRPSIVDGIGVGGEQRSFVFDNGRLITSRWPNGNVQPIGTLTSPGAIDAVSALFASATVTNEFTTEAVFRGASEWVLTFPTKRFYVDNPSAAASANFPIPPFTQNFNRFTAAGLVENQVGFACEGLVIGFRNREELVPTETLTVDFSPAAPGTITGSSLCFETQIVSFNQAANVATGSKIFGSRVAANIETGSSVDAGFALLDFTRTSRTATAVQRRMRPSIGDNHVFRGLPVTGFWAVSLENVNAQPNKQAVYGGAYTHKRTRSCVTGSANLTCPSVQ